MLIQLVYFTEARNFNQWY